MFVYKQQDFITPPANVFNFSLHVNSDTSWNQYAPCMFWLVTVTTTTENKPNILNRKAYNTILFLSGFNDTEYNEQISMLIHDGLFPIVVTTSALNLSNFRVNAH